jgi:predicted AlkP superfamily phosphohydrolase/phosphomutase
MPPTKSVSARSATSSEMILVVAWDGADLGFVEPWVAAGDLPVLASLLARGAVRRLESTRPPVTFPAWTSFLTAATPDRHGLADFTLRDGYRVRFANASDRRLPTIFARMTAAGLRVGTYGVPATYPPEPLSAFQVPGFDTPFGASPAARMTRPETLARRLLDRYGTLAIEGPSQVRIDGGWHRAALEKMVATIEARTKIFGDLLAEESLDCAMIHFIEPDTVSHQFRHFCDPASPRYTRSDLCDAMRTVYRALDASLGRLQAAAGEDANVVVLSDHGSAPSSDRAIFWNRWLAETGRLRFTSRRPARAGSVAKAVAMRFLPRGLHARAFSLLRGAAGRIESGARFAGIDWSGTAVFSEELGYQPAFWLNLAGREPSGTVAPQEVEKVLDELERDLLALRDPFDGHRVVRRVWRRGDLYDGPFSARLPDMLVDLEQPSGIVYAAGSSRGGREPAVFRRLRPEEMTGARGTSMPGAHSLHGLCAMAGPGVRPGRYATGTLPDAGATVLALAGLAPGAGANGRAWMDCVYASSVAVGEPGALDEGPAFESVAYTAAEERIVAERLRALGYIE